jgi:hypothetical protein
VSGIDPIAYLTLNGDKRRGDAVERALNTLKQKAPDESERGE